MLAYAVVDVRPAKLSRLDQAMQLGERAIGPGEIGGAADETGHDGHKLLEYFLR
jgi:hypothetical protein